MRRQTNRIENTHMNKETLLHALAAFIAQRSGISFREYHSPGSSWGEFTNARKLFRQDRAPILRHGRHARRLLAFVSRRSISADDLLQSSRSAYSGRLSFVVKGENATVDYAIGQYFPTEYRAAACAVLARAIWEYFRNGCGYTSPDQIRNAARREFGRGIASAWF
jgi:hypothetical protein